MGEDVIFCKLIRDGALRHLNPWKLSDLQCLRCGVSRGCCLTRT